EISPTSSQKCIRRMCHLWHMIVTCLVHIRSTLQNYSRSLMIKCQPVVAAMPVVMGAVALVLMTVDQATDIISSYEICNVPCQCDWYDWHGSCNAPFSSSTEQEQCLEAFGNWTQAMNYCQRVNNKDECHKREWSQG
ncbi:unnamed protein product, partial [Meganyctiphanes norvegica]